MTHNDGGPTGKPSGHASDAMNSVRKLLIGTWRSDQRRTLQTFHKYHCMRGVKKRRVAGLFGRLVVRYTHKYIYDKLPNFEDRACYDVVAEDANTIVIRIHTHKLKKQVHRVIAEDLEALFEPRLEQIHFVRSKGRQYYWVGCGRFCEWFCKEADREGS